MLRLTTYRVGKRGGECPRPLKVVLKDKNKKFLILKNARKLKKTANHASEFGSPGIKLLKKETMIKHYDKNWGGGNNKAKKT